MNKTVLSFDVGIVNLAYCIIKKKEDKFEILKWDLINIDENKITCNHINRNKDLCGQNAKYAYDNLNLCSSHYKSFMKTFDKEFLKNFPHEKIENKEEKSNCCEKRCKLSADFNHNNNNYCNKHFEKIKKEYITNNTPKKLKNQNSNHKSINNLSNILFNKLDNLKEDFLNVDEVLIENQPSLINPTMKTISALLYSYFTLRGIIDKNITKSKIAAVHFISPQNKLKINKENTEKTLSKAKNKEIKEDCNEKTLKRQEYLVTKDLGKKYCKKLIEKEDNYIKILDSHKKNDDLCDSFLQGFYYLFYKDGDFPETYIKILDEVTAVCDKELTEKEKKKYLKKLEESIK
jgi:hypothetical protein